MSSEFTPEDIDAILEGIDSSDEEEFYDNDSSSQEKKSTKKSKRGAVAAGVIAVLLAGFAVLGNQLNNDSNPEAEPAPESTTEATTVNQQQEMQLVNAEEVQFVKTACTTMGGWGELEKLPTYSEPAKLPKAREDMVKVLESNIGQLSTRKDTLSNLPNESLKSAQGVISDGSILDTYAQVGESPTSNNVANAQIITSAYQSYIDSLKSMKDDLSKPASYDSNGLNNAIAKAVDSFDAINNSFSENIKSAFSPESYENYATLNAISNIPDCSVVETSAVQDTVKVNMEEQTALRNAFINDRCNQFMSGSESSTDEKIQTNRKLCEKHLAKNYEDKDVVIAGNIADLPESLKQFVTSQPQSSEIENTTTREVQTSEEVVTQDSSKETTANASDDNSSETMSTTESGSDQ